LSTTVFDGKAWVEAPKSSLEHWTSMYGKVAAAMAARPEIRMAAGDPEAWKVARSYSIGVKAFQRTTVASVGEDLKRSFNAGPGPIIADSMRAYTGTQIGLTNVGGVRADLLAGPLTTAQVYEVIPFGNTLVTLKATGAQVIGILEDGIDFGLSKYGDSPANPLIYVSGLRVSVKPANPKGSRIVEARVVAPDGSSAPLDPGVSHTMVVNNFIAAGGDLYTTLASIEGKKDTGHIDAEAFYAYVKDKTLVNEPARIAIEKQGAPGASREERGPARRIVIAARGRFPLAPGPRRRRGRELRESYPFLNHALT
jgi:5'-nucleotidase / UDP-sugar diphosphatase